MFKNLCQATPSDSDKASVSGEDIEVVIARVHRVVNWTVVAVLALFLLAQYVAKREIRRTAIEQISWDARVGKQQQPLRSLIRAIANEEAERQMHINELHVRAIVRDVLREEPAEVPAEKPARK